MSRDIGARPGVVPVEDIDAKVLREHVASVYFTYRATFAARMVFVFVFGGFMYAQLDDPWALAFVALHVLLYVGFYFSPRWHPGIPASQSAFWARRITKVVIVLGLADGLAPWLFVPSGNLSVTSVLAVVMMGNCARAVQSLRPLKAAMIGHTVPMMGSLIIALALQATSLHAFLAVFAAVYLLMMLRVGVQEHRQLTNSLILRFENEALAARLKEQVAATERASAEKTRFLAAASHDLRQPMHAIALFGAAMESGLRDHPERANAERLMRAVNALGESLDTMLDVSRLDAGVVSAAPRALALDTLLLALHHSFSAQAEHKGLQLRVRPSGLWVHTDPQLLYRLLSNLVDNALKYTRQGGVTVVAHARGAQQVWLEVRDTGIGIAADQLGRIFEEFYQVDNPGRDRARGLGIGLSIVQRLSRLLAHPVQVQSRPGRGTRFRLVLNAAEPAAGADDERLFDGPDGPVQHGFAAPRLQGRILLIDDEAEIREGMVQLLHAYALETVAVADEAAAVQVLAEAKAAARPFALLLCDYRLADGADGLQVAQRLRERFGHMPLLLITGETAPERLARVRASGTPVLSKPVSAATLLQAIAELTGPAGRA
ncbi:ATP-binding protein [Xenophilus arseniciresistens]|uniref:histidine kinase n=1 Tax=Xenophilus arseniciresistens TaxID=1283306 RepID=A0AAE3N8R7_9BURK|nr:ATP-binding protein [Xenophilus arseniciresistens]MDA7415364.1 ATP-binding protein [Xenophilus arseniciresistens]